MLQRAISHTAQDRNGYSMESAGPERPLGRPSMPSLRARTSPLKFFASSSTPKPKEVHDSHHEWEKGYLKDLRFNRPTRPSGARSPPAPRIPDLVEHCDGTPLRTSSAMSFRPSLPLRQTSPSRIPEQERCSTALSQRRDIPDNSSSVLLTAGQIPLSDKHDASAPKGQPLVQTNTEVTRLRDSCSVTRISSGVYRERGHRLVEKEEARMLREALEMVHLEAETRLHSAAQDEASDLVWKHQNPGASRGNLDAPYLYKQRMWSTSHGRSQSDIPVVTKANREFDHSEPERPVSEDTKFERNEYNMDQISEVSAADGQKDGPGCVQRGESCHEITTSKRMDQDVDHIGKSQDKSTNGHACWDSPQKRAYMNLSFSLPQIKPSGRRRSSGSKTRTPSGSLFRNPDDKIYEEPDEMKQEPTKFKSQSTKSAGSVPLRSTTRNPITRVRAASPPCIRTMTDPVETKEKHSRTEIHRNPPSQSRNPSYLQNKSLPASLEQSKDSVAKGDGTDAVEIRGDDIRAATSMRLRDRSPKLPSPTVVSNAKGRPIVSFDKHWIPGKTDLKPRDSLPQRPSAHLETCLAPSTTRFKPPILGSTASAPAIPTINFPAPPSIQIDEAPSVPSISKASVPSISISMEEKSSTPTGQRTKFSRPLPTPSEKKVTPVSGRPLPHHSSTAPVNHSKPHWSPAQHRATAQCAGCALSISGRVVRASSQRFHPECFTCFHCSEQLECVAFYPEPDSFRNERLARIRARTEGTAAPDEAGKTWADDGDESLRFYCHLDFHERFSPRCRSCKTPIEGEVIVACGGEWHAGHFFCAQCGDPFDQKTPFVEKDGYA
ncbi:MAG: hypothetical protein LQ341_005469, partial [Variospora aurantia]